MCYLGRHGRPRGRTRSELTDDPIPSFTQTSGKSAGRAAVLFLEDYAIKYVILLCSMSARLSLQDV